MIDYQNDTLMARAERGAALLDRDLPDWFMRINTDDLRLQSCFSCVFGQLYVDGYYDEGERRFFGDSDNAGEDAAAHGFTLGDRDNIDDDDDNWPILTEAWTNLVNTRLANADLVNSGTN